MYDNIHVPQPIRDITNLWLQSHALKVITQPNDLTTLIQHQQAQKTQKKKLLKRLVSMSNLGQPVKKTNTNTHKTIPSKVRIYRLRQDKCRQKKTIFKNSKVSFSFTLV